MPTVPTRDARRRARADPDAPGPGRRGTRSGTCRPDERRRRFEHLVTSPGATRGRCSPARGFGRGDARYRSPGPSRATVPDAEETKATRLRPAGRCALRRDQRVHQVPGAPTPTRPCLARPHGRGRARTRASSPGASSCSRARTSAWLTRRASPSRRRGPRGRVRRTPRMRVEPRGRHDLPRDRPRSRTAWSRRSERRSRTLNRPSPCRCTCATRATGGRSSSGTGRGTGTRTTSPGRPRISHRVAEARAVDAREATLLDLARQLEVARRRPGTAARATAGSDGRRHARQPSAEPRARSRESSRYMDGRCSSRRRRQLVRSC